VNRLSRANFDRALRYISEHGSDLHRALAAHFFGPGDSEPVRRALASHRNEDGGFGHGLEPDFYLPDSSPMATSIGLQILADLETPASDPWVESALRYLVHTRDDSLALWPPVPPSVVNFPHAPWWKPRPRPAAELALNPTAELVGYFFRWWEAGVAAPVQEWLDETQRQILSLQTMEPHDLMCCVRLAESPGVPREAQSVIAEHLLGLVGGAVETDPTAWDTYGVKPLTAAPRPDSLLSPALAKPIAQQLEYELGRQDESGAWQPHWDWGESYPDVWVSVRPVVAADNTLRTLRALSAWDYVEAG